MATKNWDLIHRERHALAADLAGLSGSQWASPSLCEGWTVQQTLAHMTATATTTPPGFIGRFAASGFSFDRFAAKGIRSNTGASPADTLARFVAAKDRTSSPPGPFPSWIGEAVIHADDIRRPLGIAHDYDMDALRTVADFYPTSNVLIGSKDRVKDVRLEATDADWSFGSGRVVRGSLLALVMAMTGRQAYLADLSGDGVGMLRARYEVR